jgi:hypothetical protein
MRPFRRDRRFSWLALFALAMQVVIGVGHVHSHDGRYRAYAEAARAGGCSGAAQSPCPAHDDESARCPICWALSLAGPTVLPQLAVIAGPIHLAATFEPGPAVASLRGSETVKFQARAPPPAPTAA